MKSAFRACIKAILLCQFMCTALTLSADESQWFRRDSGLVPDGTALPTEFGEGPGRQWRTELPPGNSTPCVVGDSIFVTTYTADKKELATVAIDRKTGVIRWKQTVPTTELEPFHVVGSPASSSPACNGTQVFAFFGSYGLLCYDMDGGLLWERRFGPFQDEFGASSSPILVDGMVILNEDHDIDSFLVAIDQKTGEIVWKTPREGATRSYSTPILIENDGQQQIVVAGSLQLSGYDPSTGKKLWWYDGLSRIVDSTPVYLNGEIYLATWTPGGDADDRIQMEPFTDALKAFEKNSDGEIGEDELPKDSEILQRFFRIDLNQNHKLDAAEWEKHSKIFERAQNLATAIRPGLQGPVSADSVRWIYQRGLPTVPSSVVYKNVLYMVKDSGIITSLDATSGELLKQGRAEGRGNYYASLFAGDGKVYLASESGVITILKADRDWKILGSHDFGERMMATPVVHEGLMLVRTDAALYGFACTDNTEDLQSTFDGILKKHGLPGGVGAAIVDGRIVTQIATGVRKIGDTTAITVDDKLHIGSCTKAMTATLAAILVDEGKIRWDTKLADVFSEYESEFHADYRDVTLSQLLSHYSGAPANCDWHTLGVDEPLPKQRSEMIRQVFTKEPVHKPNTMFLYSNVGVTAAGAMLERITDRSWETLMQERLFGPLKMTSAGFGPPSKDGAMDQPWGHRAGVLKIIPAQHDNVAALGPAGTVHLSTADWCKFALLHLGADAVKPPLLTPESLTHIHTPYPTIDPSVTSTGSPYGFGWVFDKRDWAGGRVFMHNGSNTLWYAVIWIAPEKRSAYMAVVNAGGDKAAKATDEMVSAMIRHWQSAQQ